jgi:surfeit locus 1 family protein
MTRHGYRFRPRWAPSLVTLVLLPGLLALGFWQLDRADNKRALRAELDRGSAASPQPLRVPLPPSDALRLQRVRAEGRFDAKRQYLLANRMRDGQRGYRLLTPLRVDGSKTAVLVARDWVPATAEAGSTPALPSVPGGVQSITGLATEGPSVGYRMGEAYVGDGGWPRRVTYLDFEAMDKALPYRLAPIVVEPDTAPGERRERLTGGVTPQRHVGYAVQWFALAGALVVIYIGVNLRREGKHES